MNEKYDFSYWIVVTISIVVCFLMLFALVSIVYSTWEYKRDCLALGDDYIYIGNIKLGCYRVIGSQLHYVDVHKEYALREYKEAIK